MAISCAQRNTAALTSSGDGSLLTFRGRILINSEPIPTNSLAILLPPSSTTAGPGDVVDLAVLAVGQRPLAYQWFFNGTNPITGACGCSLLVTNLHATRPAPRLESCG